MVSKKQPKPRRGKVRTKRSAKRVSKKGQSKKRLKKRPKKRSKKLTRRALDNQFEQLLAEQKAEYEAKLLAERQQHEADVAELRTKIAEIFIRPEETKEQRSKRLTIQFDKETKYLLPRKGQSTREALEMWAARNGWTSEELWAEYRRRHANVPGHAHVKAYRPAA